MEDKNILEHYSDLSVGDVMARARQSYGLSLYDASQKTLIRADIIEALENEDKEKLPSRVYTIGFIKTYAEFLGLDADKMIYLYKIQVIGADENDNKKKKDKPKAHKDFEAIKSSSLSTYIIFGAGALLVGSAICFVLYTVIANMFFAKGEAELLTDVAGHNVASLSAIMDKEENIQKSMISDVDLARWKALELPAIDERTNIVMPSAGAMAYGEALYKDGLVLKATRTVWLKLSSSEGDLLLNTILKQGDVVHISPASMLSLETLYGEALDVFVAGEYQGYLKGKENDKRELILSKDSVSKHLAEHSDKKQLRK
jgi:hypothetical protein